MPIGCPAATSGGISDAAAPDHASSSGSKASCARSSQPVRLASDRSLTSSAPSPRATHSATLNRRTAARVAGTCAASQRCLVSAYWLVGGLPVRRVKLAGSTSRASCSASAPSRPSCQAMAGATGVPWPSTSIPVSPMLVMPTPPTDPPDARSASSMAVKALSRNAIASTSTPCGPVYQGVAARPDPTGRPASEYTTALVDDVPTSTPSQAIARPAPPGPCAGSRWRRRRAPARPGRRRRTARAACRPRSR